MRLKEIRIRRNLTQAQVAAALGMSSGVYSRYETGARQPSIDTVMQLAEYFGVSVGYLLGSQDIEETDLSDYEYRLLTAFRQADERAKEDALKLLTAHIVEPDK